MATSKKKKVEEVDESLALIAKLRSMAPKKDGGGCTWEVSSTKDLVLSAVNYVLTTGIESFDSIVGGMPFGRMVELYGLESCGKTAMSIRCAVRAMTKNISEVTHNADKTITLRPLKPEECKIVVMYVDNEQSLDEDGKLMVDGQRLDVVGFRCDTTDDMFKAIDGALTLQEKRAEAEDEDGIKRFMFIVVDTIASTSTKEEIGADWGKQDFPRQALQISKALRQLTRRVNRYNVCVLFTNQVRTNFKAQQQKGGNVFAIKAGDYTSVGGMALRYYASHRVFMYALNSKYKLLPDGQFAAGLQVGFHTVKNRLRPPLRDGRMVLLFDKDKGGLNDVFSTLETLVFLGFVDIESETKHTGYTLRFKANNIIPTTFDRAAVETTLDDDEDAPRVPRKGHGRKDPGFKTRAEWPKFYEEHKADVDVLWHAAIEYAMSTKGLDGGVQVVEEENPVNPAAED